MWQDPIVEETRAARKEIVEECGEDVHAFFEHLRARERQHIEDVVTLSPNEPESDIRHVASR
jgi:predicted NUDIX family NTP pyrophosphohydrolase